MELRRKSSSNRLSDSLSKKVPNSKSSPSTPLKKKHPRGTCFSTCLAFNPKAPHAPTWGFLSDTLENFTQVLTSLRPGTLKQIGGGWASVNQSVNHHSVNQAIINPSINQPINQSASQSVSRSVSQSINQHIRQSIQLSINQSINQSVSQPVNQTTHSSINQSINHVPLLSR